MTGPRSVPSASRPVPTRRDALGATLPRPTERDCQDAIVEGAQLLGYLVHHCRPARTDHGWATPIQGDAGFPDLVLAHRDAGVVVFLELKRPAHPGGAVRPRPDQLAWQTALARGGVRAEVVRVPEDQQALLDRLAHWARGCLP